MATLRQLHKYVKAIEQKYLSEAAKTALFTRAVEVSIFEAAPVTAINLAQDTLVANMDTFTKAATTYFRLRNVIAAGNAAVNKAHGNKSINGVLCEIAMLNTIIHGLEWVETADVTTQSTIDIAVANQQALHNKYTTSNGGYISESVTVSNVRSTVQESVKAHLKELRATRDELNDTLTALNIFTTIDLPDTLENHLKELGIL